ncbi:hypothetical protein MGALJ_29950 [Mycobacterium gallinarum]|uniref:Uncharacterized protein n=1 Tax=Mycobacterium gallinarum TaxID=39689 RepID=A0A9W4FFT2_9MYCO|nr:hypothetical protein MGALJ_29950 [Mycobacterium gallinarum]
MRSLLLKYDGHADEPLLGGVPLAIDTSPERISGNALRTIIVSLPVHVTAPHEVTDAMVDAFGLIRQCGGTACRCRASLMGGRSQTARRPPFRAPVG